MVKRDPYSATHLGTRLDLHSLQIFLTAVDVGSLSEAAAREHLVVSAVSRRIAELERVVGTALLERRHGGITPTAAGLDLIEHARELRSVLERIEEGLDAHRTGLRGEVKLHANASVFLDRLAGQITSFMDAHPGVDVRVKQWDSVQVIRGVREGHAHIGLYSSYAPAPGLRVLPYSRERLVILAPIGHPIARDKTVHFEDTLEFDHIVMQDGETFSALLIHMQGIARRFAAPMRIRLKVGTVGAACRFVEAGAGITVVREKSGRLFAGVMKLAIVGLHDDWAAIGQDLCTRHELLPPAARLLVDHLTKPEPETPPN